MSTTEAAPRGLGARLARNSFHSASGRVVAILAWLALTPSLVRALGPEGFLINVSRGSVIDENALIEALEDGVIAGAGLDVYADEPRVPERLLALDQVVLLPHLASATNETRQAMAELVVDNLDAFYATGKLRASVPLPT